MLFIISPGLLKVCEKKVEMHRHCLRFSSIISNVSYKYMHKQLCHFEFNIIIK